MKQQLASNSFSIHAKPLLFTLLCLFLGFASVEAQAKRRGTFHLGLHGGFHSATVNITAGGDDANFDFSGPALNVDFGMRFGRKKIQHDLGLTIHILPLTNVYSEKSTSGSLIKENIDVLGGGLKYVLNGSFRKSKRLGFLLSVSGGLYQATLTRQETTPQIQRYASGFGGSADLALIVKLSRKKGKGLELVFGATGAYITLSEGQDELSRVTSDLVLSSIGGYGGLNLNI